MGLSQSAVAKFTARDRAILDVKIQRDRLKQYQKKIQLLIEKEKQLAVQQSRVGNKDVALLALKMKKYQEQLLEQSYSQLLNLEQLVASIEFSLVETQVLEGLKRGNLVLQDLQKEISLKSIETIMSEAAESIEYQKEVSQLLASKLDPSLELQVEEECDLLMNDATSAIRDNATGATQDGLSSIPYQIPAPEKAAILE